MTSDDEVIWQRAHPGYILVEAVGFVKALIIPLVLLVVNRGFHFDLNSPDAIGTWFALAVMAGGLVIGAIQWKLFSFALTPTRLLVKSGVFSRRERSIPYERIQSVDLVQTPLLRMLRLSRVSIQTAVAGSDEDANVEIKAIGEDDAGVLRSRLMAAGRDEYPGDIGREADGVGAGPPHGGTVQTGQVVYGLPIGRLMLAGATSGTVAPAFALLAVVVNWANELVPDSVYSNNRLWSIGDGGARTIGSDGDCAYWCGAGLDHCDFGDRVAVLRVSIDS